MKITCQKDTIYLADEKTGHSGILRLRDGMWKLAVGSEAHVYDDLETAIAFAEKILADGELDGA